VNKKFQIWFLLTLIASADLIGQINVSVDIQGNTYKWSAFEIKKLNSSNEIVFTWQNPSGGAIQWVDVSDPFRILTYSKELNQIIWLNNKLAPIGDPVHLSDFDLLEPIGIGMARDGGIWLLDAASNHLVKQSKRMETEISAPVRIGEILTEQTWIQIAEWKQFLALLLPGKQLWIADLFGQVLKKIPTEAQELRSASEGLLLISPSIKAIYRPDTGQLNSLIKKP
jgi:hypothetical protein